MFYLINYWSVDIYEFVSKRARQKGKILCTMVSYIYRQNSKFLKIIYTKMWFEFMKDMMNSRYRDRVTDGQRYGRSVEDMMNIMQKERR